VIADGQAASARLAVPTPLPAQVDAGVLVAAVWNSPGVGVAVWDRNGQLVAVNDHAAPAPVGPLMHSLLDDVVASAEARVGVEFVSGNRVWETAWLPLCRDGRVVQVACLSLDVTAARLPALTADVPGARSAVWTSRLLAVTQALNATQGPAAALGDAFGQVAKALGASSAMVAVLDGDRLTFRPDLFSTRPFGGMWSTGFALDDPASFSVVAVTRNEPVWIEDEAAMRERFPLADPALRGVTDERAWAAVTIRVGSEPIGVLRLAWPVPQTFPPEQRAFLQATADHAGHVLHRVRLLEQEQALRAANEAVGERNAQLLALARGLAAARSSVQVGAVLAASRYGGIGAVAGGVGLLDEAGRRLRVLNAMGGRSWGEVSLDSPLPFVRAALTGQVQMSTREEVARLEPSAARWMHDAGSLLALSVPLYDENRVVGSLSVQLPTTSIDDVGLQHVHAVAALVGQALGRAAAQEQAQNAVEELQRALLPRRLPDVPGVTVRAGYRASVRASEIGGDFYDVVSRDGGGVVLLLGDVQGHDLTAAAIMAELRALLHTLAADGEPPAELLLRADRFLDTIEPDRLATAIVVDLDPATGLAAIGVAGHLPPLLGTTDGTRLVDVRPGLPLGLLDPDRTEQVIALPARARLVLLTDGVVERRAEAVSDSLARLAGALPDGGPPDPAALVDELLANAPGDTGDDAAVLVADIARTTELPSRLVRTLPPGVRTPPTARHWALAGLQRLGLGGEELADALTVLTELVTNATRAASDRVTVDLEAAGNVLRIGVRDDSDHRPRLRSAADDETEGRGLTIVEALARRWWVEEHEIGKTVWAELPLPGAIL
jgi:GAF domain-containing protein/anti-sigma regulatory factor (Ser/Thr protein kinase)